MENLAGEILRKRREELGLNIEEVAKVTRIRYEFLKALEEGNLEKLPVEVYVKGYIREYAKILDIDPNNVIDVYVQQITPQKLSHAENKEIPETEVSQSKRLKYRSLLIPLLSILTLASVLFIFFIFTQKKQTMPPVSETKKDELIVPPIQEPPLAPETEKEELITPEKQTAPTVLETKKEEIVKPREPLKVEDAKKVEGTHHILEITAIDATWLLIEIDGTTSKDILLQQGESVKLDAKKRFSLKIGNAGGVKLVFDGKEIGPLGEKGQVISLNLPSTSPEN